MITLLGTISFWTEWFIKEKIAQYKNVKNMNYQLRVKYVSCEVKDARSTEYKTYIQYLQFATTDFHKDKYIEHHRISHKN